jgi:hypothetical protein
MPQGAIAAPIAVERVTLDGVSGTIKVSYPYRQYPREAHVSHEPDARGKRSEAYLETKRELRDDWSTDLTHSERLVDIMTKLGVVFE